MDLISDPEGLIDKYEHYEPNNFEEMLEAMVASFEDCFARGAGGVVPFMRMLTPRGFEHFDLTGEQTAEPQRLWSWTYPYFIRGRGARIFGAATPSGQHTDTGDTLFADCRVFDAAGRVEIAQCLIDGAVEGPARPCRRVSDWWRAAGAEVADDPDSAPVLAALADVWTRQTAQAVGS